MKIFLLTLVSLITLIIFASCGLIYTSSADKETVRIAEEYGGIYVFDKEIRDEIIQREKERKEYSQNRFKMIEEEREKILRDFFTEQEIQDFRDMVARDRKRRVVVNYGYHNVYKKENEIFKELEKKYPDLINSKFPETLSNGYKYGFSAYGSYDDEYFKPYYQKIKEYMGEEIFNKLKGGLKVTSYYVDKNGKEIPITMFTYISTTITTYGLYGDESRPRFTETRTIDMSNYGNIFYLIDNKFVKHKREY